MNRFPKPRRRAVLLLAACCAAFAWDLTRPAADQWGAAAAVAAIHAYQRTLAPVLRLTGAQCHFTPTCSHYAEASIRRNGLAAGGWRAVKRVARCGPWTPMGTIDWPD